MTRAPRDPTTAPPPPQSGPLAVIDNLRAFYELENVNDSHSNALHLTNNGVSFASGKVGNAGVFAGADELTRASTGFLGIGGDFTIALWFKTSSGSAQLFVGKWDGGSNLEYQLYIFENVVWLVRDATATNNTVASPSTYFDNAWHLAIATYTSSDDILRLSVDNGTEATSAALAGAPNDAAAPITIGSIGGASFFTGQLDQIGFWSRVLTSDERTWLYNSGAGRSYADIVAEGGGGGAATDDAAILIRPVGFVA